jgi:hypothetical protein
MANLGSLNYAGLAATVPGGGVGVVLGSSTNRFAVQIAALATGAARVGTFTLGTSKLTDATWQDITSSVMSVGWERGASAGQRPLAGQLDITLRNNTRTYSPGVSTYYAPGTMIRVVCGDPTSITSVQFTGITQTWNEAFDGNVRFVNITALEPMFMVGQVDDLAVDPIGSGDNLTQRIQRLADNATFPFSLETNRGGALAGTQTFQATTMAADTLTDMYLTVDSVDGLLFSTKAGKLGVCERAGFYVSSAYSLGAGGNVPVKIGALTLTNDSEILLSQVSIARAGGTEQTFSQPGFAARFYASTFSRDDLLTNADADLATVASGLLGRGTQTWRPVSAVVESKSTAAFGFLMGVDIGTVVDVKDSTFVTFGAYSVCRLAHSIQPLNRVGQMWTCTVEFEPTSSSTRT